MGEMEILKERAFFHWLYNIEGIGRKTIRRLMDAVGSAERVFYLEEEIIIKVNIIDCFLNQRRIVSQRVIFYKITIPMYHFFW